MVDEKRFAVLIDADNVSFKYIKYILDEISNYGSVTYKRIYADWTNPTTSSWKNVLLEHSIKPIQQFRYTIGKNATDSAMIIDAMDILYSSNVDGFCLVSSDSDFTKLAVRLRESGMTVIGMGEMKTPKPFSAACNVFKYLDILTDSENQSEDAEDAQTSANGSAKASETENMTNIDTILKAMINIINENGDDEKGLDIGELGNHTLKRYPDFDVRNYGYTKLSKFLTSFDCLTLHKTNTSVFVRLKDNHTDLETIRQAIVDYIRSKGEPVNLGQLNQWVMSSFPHFNVKNYGYTNFVKFVNDIDGALVKSSGKNGRIKHVLMVH